MNEKSISPLKAIRKKCLDCMGCMSQEVKYCPVLRCSLWKFRLGIHPYTEKNVNNVLLRKELFEGKENWTSDMLKEYFIKNYNEGTEK